MKSSVALFEIFPWNDHFETGIEKIDLQHKKLVSILNRLAANQANLANRDSLNKIFEELIDYTDYHFKAEEGIWSQYFGDDSWFIEHEKTHDGFIDEIVKIKNDPNKNFDDTIYELILILAQWLAYHILDTDKRMAKVVLELQEGHSLEEAKEHSNHFMNGSVKALIQTVLKMYGDISTRTLDLMREKALRMQAEEELLKSEEKWRFLLSGSGENIWDYDFDKEKTCISRDNCEAEEMLHNSLQQFDFFSEIHPDDLKQVKEDFIAHLLGETEFFYNKHRVLRKDGGWTWILSRGKVLESKSGGGLKRFVGVHSDITEQELSAVIFKHSSQAMFISDSENRIISINPAFTEITQYEKDEVIGQTPDIFCYKELNTTCYKELWYYVVKDGEWTGEIVNKRKNGEVYTQELKINIVKNSEGKIDHFIGFFSDITEKKKSQDIILRQANFDALTDLENRRMFDHRLDEAILRSKRSKQAFAVLFIDLDRFKDINDAMGHTVGDTLLVEVSKRIKKEIRETDILSRFGGDEFTLLLPEIKNTNVIDRIAQNIIDSIKRPFYVEKTTFHISASIGITLYPDDGVNSSTLLRNADQAMYQAKRSGRSQYNYFTEHMQIMAQKRHKILHELHEAIEQKQFEVYYQPIVNAKNGEVYKAEALVRWNHPINGLVLPGEFISLAEETGLIVEIGDFVYKEAVMQSKIWQKKYGINFKISVNKSPAQFRSRKIIDEWMKFKKENGIDTRNVIIEITENLLMQEDELVKEQLLRLRDAGIEIAIDDFGTGYSSLSYLKKFSIDYLKIDKSFVDYVASSKQDKILCEAMIAMAHKLDIKVIAEGVEDELQKQVLSKMGCDFLQGYLYSEPLPSQEFERLFLV
ncbi:bacteriohemerythrin [Sulfurimonas sp. C5]|uniref:bacteriohemerythrin n=1 Tax=Sulfurimonas sp. C5 TaxID=3036947 RepID=UPI002454DB7C|nr:bacteriohemerythrin [Sulfurimonas sp. C5]MDH4945190.1 bacteriohemerythrin [Sulfurimonas sp. C5]